MLKRYKMPVLIPAAIPGSPLEKLFSNVDRHIAHWLNESADAIKINMSDNNFFSMFLYP